MVNQSLEATPLTPISAEDQITVEFESAASLLAMRARNDHKASRDALYQALRPKIEAVTIMICRRYFVWPGRLLEPDDLRQEGYLLYIELLQEWNLEDPFCAWFFGSFPWKLRRFAAKQIRPLRLPLRSSPPDATATISDEEYPHLLQFVRQFAATLPTFARDLLICRMEETCTIRQFAESHCVSERTARRTLKRTRYQLQQFLRDAGVNDVP